MKQRILVVGKSFKNLEKYLEEQGYDFVVLKDRLFAPKKPRTNQVLCNFSNQQTVLDTVKTLPGGFSGVMTVYENYILPAAWITHELNLPGLPLSAAEACTDKQIMRQAFARAPEPISPAFTEVSSLQDLKAFAAQHHFPLILKPANLAKSLLVTKNHNIDELITSYQAAQQTIAEIYKKYAPHREPKLLVEEFLQGSIHSVDAFIGQDGIPQVLENVVDYQTGYDIGHDDNFHYSRILPSALSKQDQQALRHVAKLGCQALGMKNTAAHIEIIMTPHGPRIVEIGARNGGYRERMHNLANGIDITGAALAVAEGRQPQLVATKNEPCAVLELFPKQAGLFKGLVNEHKLRQLSSLVYISIKPSVGDMVGKAAEGHKMCAVIILHNSNAEQFEADLEFVSQSVHVQTV